MNSLLSFLVSSAEGELTYETHHWLLPETAEIIYGGLASVLVIGALAKFAGPMIKKSLAARTERIQADMDNARNTRETAEVEAGRIRTALGDISAERSRILAEADAQAAAVLSEGRARVQAEMVEVEAKQCQTLQMRPVVLATSFVPRSAACQQLPLSALLQTRLPTVFVKTSSRASLAR